MRSGNVSVGNGNSKRKFDAGIFFGILILVTIVGTVTLIRLQVQTDRITDHISAAEEFAVVVAITREGEPVVTQVLLYQPETRRASLIDVPGNLGTVIGDLQRVDRIDRLFMEYGPQRYREEIASMLDLDVEFHLAIEEQDLSEIIDLAGGVELFLSDTVVESLNSGQVFPGGNVVLDGHKAGQYLAATLEHKSGVERVTRLQRFLQRVLLRIGERSEHLGRREVAPYLQDRVTSNLDRRALVALSAALGELASEQMVYRRIQGVSRTVDAEGGSQELLFPHFEGRWLRETVRQLRETLRSEETLLLDGATVRLEILNGTDVNGLARRTRELYEGYGFEVVSIGNAETNEVENTVFISRTGDPAYAERAAQIVGSSRIMTESSLSTLPNVDVTVILGNDFDGRYVR